MFYLLLESHFFFFFLHTYPYHSLNNLKKYVNFWLTFCVTLIF